jgi:hypothetical protein
MAESPHLAFPIRLEESGLLATVEDGSLDEVAQGIYFIAGTEPGAVADLRDTGVPAVTFLRNGVPLEQISGLLQKQEPRASIVGLRPVDDRTGGVDQIEIDVALVESGDS